MPATFEKGFDIQFLLKKIEKMRRVEPSGRVVFAPGITEVLPVLTTAVKFDKLIPELAQRDIIHKALFAIPGDYPVSARRFQEELGRQEGIFFDRKAVPYVLVTNLSVEYFKEMRPVSVGDSLISFNVRVPSRFSGERDRIHIIKDFPEPALFSTWTKVRVHARSSHEAADLALSRLGILRAIWNLCLVRGQMRQSSRPSPMSSIIAGPVHTIHHPDGSLAADAFWLEPGYTKTISAQRVKKDWSELKSFEREVRRDLAKLPYRDVMEDALRRYVNALDMVDWDAAMVKLWGVLESLTATMKSGYDVTIQRVAFIYRDREWHLQVLRYLRTYRNRIVHADYSRRDKETILCQVKSYVEDLIIFHLSNGREFSSIEECGEFLDLAPDYRKLKRRSEILRKALRIRKPNGRI